MRTEIKTDFQAELRNELAQVERGNIESYKNRRASKPRGSETSCKTHFADDTRHSSFSKYSPLGKDSPTYGSTQTVFEMPTNADDNNSLNHVQFLQQRKSSSFLSTQSSSFGLRYRNLGRSGLRISTVGLGTWTTFNEDVQADQAESIITAAYEAGINVFDISEAHSGIKAEVELGKILKQKSWSRATFVVMTKIYWRKKSVEKGLSRKYIIECVKSSLARLQLEYIDVILIHKVDSLCPTEGAEVVRAMNHVINQGWAMYWGTSRWSPHQISEVYANCRQFNCITPIVEQTEYHMFSREKSELYMPEICSKMGVGLIAWSPMSMGIESEGSCVNIPWARERSLFYDWYNDETGYKRTEILSWLREQVLSEEQEFQLERLILIAQLAEKLDCSLTQLCIAWSLKNKTVHCLLLGADTLQQLHHTLDSLKIVSRLSPCVMSEVDRILENKPYRPPIISTLELR